MPRSGPVGGVVLYPVVAVPADGPDDTAIQPVPVSAQRLLAIGYCAPSAHLVDVADAEAGVRVWQRHAPRPAQPLQGMRVANAKLASVGEVYLVPTGTATTLPSGEYIFELPDAMPDGSTGWFALLYSMHA